MVEKLQEVFHHCPSVYTFFLCICYNLYNMRVLSTNILANHEAYPKILAAYNMLLKEKGRVNDKNFYETVVLKEIPEYKMSSWYKFLRKFKTEAGIVPVHSNAPVLHGEEGQALATSMLSNHEATQRAIALALNISADALQKIIEDPTSLSPDKRAELFLKVMKAQDGRVKALGMMRADNREQERFDRMMDSAAFS